MKAILIMLLMYSLPSFASGECLVSHTKQSTKRVDSGWYIRIGKTLCQVNAHEGKTLVVCSLEGITGEQITFMSKGTVLVSFASGNAVVNCTKVNQYKELEI